MLAPLSGGRWLRHWPTAGWRVAPPAANAESPAPQDLGGVGGSDTELRLLLAGSETLGPPVDGEGRDVVVTLAFRIGDGEDDADVAHRAMGGEGLGAVEDPAAVDLARPAAGAGGVGAGTWLSSASPRL